jgi:hypothetical protein
MAINATAVDSIIREEAPQLFADAVTRFGRFLPFFNEEDAGADLTGPSWQVKTAGHSNVVNFSPGDALGAPDEYEHTQASLGWGRFQATVRAHGQELDKLATQGPKLINNYLMTQLSDAMMEMVSQQDSQARGGATTNGFTGITEMVASGNTYASIDRTTVTNWQSVSTAVGGAVAITHMDAAHLSLVETRQGNYNVIFTTQSIADDLSALTSGNGVAALRAVSNTADTAVQIAKLGFGGLDPLTPSVYYRNRPVIAIPGYTSGRLDLIDTSGLRIRYLRKARTELMGKTNDDLVWSLSSIGQVYLFNPRKQSGALTGIT